MRLSTVTGGIYTKRYTYRDINSSRTTSQVASVVYDLPTDQTFAYTYDNMGNIATYTDANGTVTYTYDALGQLTKAAGSTTYNYTYDTVGNILTGNGHSYTYGDTSGWKDLLTKVDGHSISYDSIGNPTTYYNGTDWTFTWAEGRRLATASGNGNTISYTYDADGLRTSKTVNGTKHTYYYAGGKLLRETYGSNTLDFFYDANGHAYALKHNDTVYYYITNLQGDVMSIVNGQGLVVATYKYDPYGNLVSSEPAANSIGAINPIRYRGYYYDTDSQLYYLQSRYYDPELGRFLNADAFASTGQGILGMNMFAYCNNNPVHNVDSSGATAKVAFSDNFDILTMPWLDAGGGGGIYIRHTGKSSFAVVEEKTEIQNGIKTAQFLGGNFDALSSNGKSFTIISFYTSVISLDLTKNYGTLSLFDLGNVFLSAGVDGVLPFAEAIVSVWSPSVTFGIKNIDVNFALHIGSIGAAFRFGEEGIKWGQANGIGYSVDISW